jgi:predicted transcriptional regulator
VDTSEKFSTKLNKEVLRKLREYAAASDRPIATIVSEAVQEYLARVEVRPAFREAVEEVVSANEELLRELAK